MGTDTVPQDTIEYFGYRSRNRNLLHVKKMASNDPNFPYKVIDDSDHKESNYKEGNNIDD